jgi:hypothetical protein
MIIATILYIILLIALCMCVEVASYAKKINTAENKDILVVGQGEKIVVETAQPSLRAQDYRALQDLYDATKGKYWDWAVPYNTVNGYPWNFTYPPFSNPCNYTHPWQGITCGTTIGGEVVVRNISLIFYNLDGE